MRTIVVGDLHGCIVEFRELVARLDLSHSDRLVLVGDLMDKGPEPVACVRFAREIGADCLLGNHEEKHLRWRRHEDRRAENPKYKNPMKPLGEAKAAQNAALSPEDIIWLQACPKMIQVNNWVIVHAGLMPGVALDNQTDDRLRVRWVDGANKMASLDPEDPQQPVGTRPWMEVWDGPQNVVYGHAAHHLRTPRVDRNSLGAEMWGIDTGCVYGGYLTALVLETREVIQVQAREAYATPPFPIPG